MAILYSPGGMPTEIPDREIDSFVRQGFLLQRPNIPQTEPANNNLVNLNKANLKQLVGLGLNASLAREIIDSRPYRDNADLFERVSLPSYYWGLMADKICY